MTWESAKKLAAARDNDKCMRCAGPAVDVHHRKPRGMGGTSDPARNTGLANLVCLCRPCHDYVHANPAWAYEAGWLVHGWNDPYDIGICQDGRMLFLDDDGGVTKAPRVCF